jgi:hypothetical protein
LGHLGRWPPTSINSAIASCTGPRVLAEDGPDIIHHNQVKWFEIVDGKDMEAAPRALVVLVGKSFHQRFSQNLTNS